MADAPNKSAALAYASAKVGAAVVAVAGAAALIATYQRPPATQIQQTGASDGKNTQQQAQQLFQEQRQGPSPAASASSAPDEDPGSLPCKVFISGSVTRTHDEEPAQDPTKWPDPEASIVSWKTRSTTQFSAGFSGFLKVNAGGSGAFQSSYQIVADDSEKPTGSATVTVERTIGPMTTGLFTHQFESVSGTVILTSGGKDALMGYNGTFMLRTRMAGSSTTDEWVGESEHPRHQTKSETLPSHEDAFVAPLFPDNGYVPPINLAAMGVKLAQGQNGNVGGAGRPNFQLQQSDFDKGIASGKPFTVAGNGSFDMVDPTDEKTHITGNTRILIQARNTPWEAVLLPCGAPDQLDIYSHWKPEGPRTFLPGVTGENGNQFAVRTIIRDKRTKTERPDVNYTTEYKLTNVSRHRGVCCNWPKKAEAKEKDDLLFLAEQNKGSFIENGGATCVTSDGKGGDTITITSRDFGASGDLSATVTVDGQKIVAEWEDEQKKRVSNLTLPRDGNGNHIADCWEQECGIKDQGYPATWDEENEPAGTPKGDGYRLEDEYRGFVLEDANGGIAHVRLDPRKKKLLVWADESTGECGGLDVGWKLVVRKGATMMSQASGIAVSFVPKRECVEMKDVADPLAQQDPPQVNFNTDAKVQFAVRVIRTPPKPNNVRDTPPRDWSKGWCTQKQSADPRLVSRSPQDTRVVCIVPRAIDLRLDDWHQIYVNAAQKKPDGTWQLPFTHAYLAKNGIDNPLALARSMEDPAWRLALTFRYTAFTIMHEIGHSCAAFHHGEGTPYAGCAPARIPPGGTESIYYGPVYCPMRYWDWGGESLNYIVPLCRGDWDPTECAWDPPAVGDDPEHATSYIREGEKIPWRFCRNEVNGDGPYFPMLWLPD